MDADATPRGAPAARRRSAAAVAPALVATVAGVVAIAAIWWLDAPVALANACPAVDPPPWWCTAAGARAHRLGATGAVVAAWAGAVAVALRTGRARPRAAWAMVAAVALVGLLAYDAAR